MDFEVSYAENGDGEALARKYNVTSVPVLFVQHGDGITQFRSLEEIGAYVKNIS